MGDVMEAEEREEKGGKREGGGGREGRREDAIFVPKLFCDTPIKTVFASNRKVNFAAISTILHKSATNKKHQSRAMNALQPLPRGL